MAATLLDLKAARLLPSAEVEDEEDLALLEARDLLFARLLQYRAYKDVSAVLGELLRDADAPAPARGRARPASSPSLLPEVADRPRPGASSPPWPRGLSRRSRCRQCRCRPPPRADGSASREQAAILVDRLRRHPHGHVPRLTADCEHDAARWSPASWRCSSSTATARSPSTRSRRWASCTCAGPAAEGDVAVGRGGGRGRARCDAGGTATDEEDRAEAGGPSRRVRPPSAASRRHARGRRTPRRTPTPRPGTPAGPQRSEPPGVAEQPAARGAAPAAPGRGRARPRRHRRHRDPGPSRARPEPDGPTRNRRRPSVPTSLERARAP